MGSTTRSAVAAAVLGTLGGCYQGLDASRVDTTASESEDGTGDAETDGDPVAPLCGADDPAPTPLRRLSMQQYENTLRDLLGGASSPGFGAALPYLADLPPDGEDGAWFANSDLRLSQQHVDGFYGIADAIAADDTALAEIAGECALAEALDDGCLRAFVREFGLRAFRRPLADDDVERFVAMIDPTTTPRDAYRDLLFTFLMAPDFLYLVETRGTPIDDREDLLALSTWELASRLSYHYWQSMPDDALFAAAADGSLATSEGLQAQVDRMLADDRVRATVRGFYGEWFALAEFSGFADTAAFTTFAGDLPLADDDAKQALRAAMVAEVDAITERFTWDEPGSFADMLLTDVSPTADPTLAAIYGVQPWSGTGDPPLLPADQRAGLLTRAAFLVTGDHKTAPLHRGAYLRRDILCMATPPPPSTLPPDALDPPPFDPDLTTRQRYEQKTAAQECQGCHANFNPIGFAQESYDALGRWRTEERLVADDGTQVGVLPIDTAVAIPGVFAGDPRPVDGPVELMRFVVDSGLVDACLARHWLRFTVRRAETSADACVVEQLTESLGDAGTIQAMIREIALQPEFAVRKVAQEDDP